MSDQLSELQRAVGRIEAKVDSLLSYREDTERRLTALERAWQRVLGAAAVVSVVASYLMSKMSGKA
jgi:hypothetical protein